MENDYKNSVIYRIYCKNPDITECYIGSTKCFEDRFYTHKSACNTKHNKIHNLYLYQFIRENGGWNNFDREILEYYPCKDEEELKLKEQEYISKFKPTLNTNNAYTSEEVKKEQIQKSRKKYRETGKAKEKERKYTEKLMNDPEKYQKKLKNKSEWGKKPKFCEVCNLSTTNNMWYSHKKSKEHLNNLKDKSLIKYDEYNQILEKVEKQKEKNKSDEKYCEFCNKTIKKNHWSEHKNTKTHINNLIQKTDLSEEQIKKLNQKFDIKNDKIKKQHSEKVYCNICDRWISRGGLTEHKKTKVHLENVNNNK